METPCKYELKRKPVPNLMPVPPYCRKAEGQEPEASKAKRLELTDPGKLLLLTESLFDNSTQELEKKINYYIETETDAKTVFIATLVLVSEEVVIRVVGSSTLEVEYRVPIAGHLFWEAINNRSNIINDISEFDPNLQKILKQYVPPKDQLYEIITIPVLSKLKRGQTQALPLMVCVVDSLKSRDFVVKLVSETFRFCLPILLNTSKYEEEERIKKQCQSLLHVARKLFSHLDDLNDLLREIMAEARRLTNAERCSLFLLDPDHLHLVAKVFDGVLQDNETTEVRIAKDQGIAGHVAVTGKVLNIKDAYQHPLFYKGMDEATGFRTRNILCFPIRDEAGIVGVAQLCNKAQGDFDFYDEEIALAFSLYCGLSIMHTLMYKKLKEAQARSKLSNELMLYHMKVSQEDVNKVLQCTNRHTYLDFHCFHFPPKRIRESETPCQILRMFADLDLFNTFRIKEEQLVRFVLYVKKGYRDTPYHNWMHAFSVTHFSYVVIKQLKLIENGYLTKLEALAYMTSCMCHDIDHRGTTNSFQLQSNSILANLYSSEGSVMEHHHLSQCLCILNTEDCNFLDGLGHSDYMRCLDLIKDMILATDLANHFNLSDKQKMLVEKGYDWSSSQDKYVFICLLMTCADLSDQIKDWDVIKQVAQQIYMEFFHQGDMEKQMGKKPVAMMDRDSASIPDLQIDFLREICLPVFTILCDLFPEADYLIDRIKRNIQCWEACKPIFDKYKHNEYTSLEILTSSEIDDEVKKVLSALSEKSAEAAAQAASAGHELVPPHGVEVKSDKHEQKNESDDQDEKDTEDDASIPEE